MKAIVYKAYGSPDELALADVDQPVPRPHEVRLKEHAVSFSLTEVPDAFRRFGRSEHKGKIVITLD